MMKNLQSAFRAHRILSIIVAFLLLSSLGTLVSSLTSGDFHALVKTVSFFAVICLGASWLLKSGQDWQQRQIDRQIKSEISTERRVQVAKQLLQNQVAQEYFGPGEVRCTSVVALDPNKARMKKSHFTNGGLPKKCYGSEEGAKNAAREMRAKNQELYNWYLCSESTCGHWHIGHVKEDEPQRAPSGY